MLYLVGTLQNAFVSPSGARKDGTTYPSAGRLQVLEDEPMESGEVRLKLHNLTCEPIEVLDYIKNKGSRFIFPVRAYKENLYLQGVGQTLETFEFPA